MAIEVAHSFLVYPAKHLDPKPQIAGASIPLTGKLFEMLDAIFEKTDDCNIDIAFSPNGQGQQQNDCLDLILAYVKSPTEPNGKLIAERLQSVTTNRSHLGLFFLLSGRDRQGHRLMLSRFPADSGIMADQVAGSLNVEFIEKVFMKSATAYKAALYVGASPKTHFWDGRAVDKQINTQNVSLSDYWIKDFLMSDFRTTPAAGTRRLATALRTVATKTTDLNVKAEIAAAARLAAGMNGTRTSIAGFANRLNLSEEVKNAIRHAMPSEKLYSETFQFDAVEFARHLAYRTVELNTGALLTANAAEFENVFTQQSLPDDQVSYTATGRVVDDRVKTKK